MKKRLAYILGFLVVFLSACGNKTQAPTEVESSSENTIAEETLGAESTYIENFDEEIISEHTSEEVTSDIIDVQKYSDTSIYFEYPVDWILTEQQGEDGRCISMSNSNEENSAVFEIVQGEAWRVNFDNTVEDYEQFLSEHYEALEITDLSSTTIAGYDARKLQFTYNENEQQYKGIKYMVIADLVSFEITYVYPTEKTKEHEMQGENILSTMQFTVAKTDVQQAFLSVLLSEQPFFYTDKYVGQYKDVLHTYNGYLKELPFNDSIMTFTQFTIVDMDGDEVPEVVLEMEDYLGFVVLRYKDGQIIGNEFGYRWLLELCEDGTSLGTSGACIYSMGKLYFVDDTFVQSDKLYRDNSYYYLFDVPVTQEEFEQVETEIFTDAPRAKWYDFTEESIEKCITESSLFVEVPEEKVLRMQQRQEYMDSLNYLTNMKRNYIGDGQKEKNENAKQYYYECKEELQKIYKLCKDNLQKEESARLKKEQQYWEEGIEKRLVQDLLRYHANSIEELEDQWLYYDYGDMYLRRILYLVNYYYGCDFYE